jgi:hypothetical protein
MPRLNDTQTILLSHASQARDGSFYPLPERYAEGGTRVVKAVATLIQGGFAAEREINDQAAIYRTDRNLGYGAFITSAGLAAIGVEREGEGDHVDITAIEPIVPAARRETKAATVLALLERGEGATLADLIAATGWLPHTTRAALTGLRKRGHTIERGRRDDATCYRLTVTA